MPRPLLTSSCLLLTCCLIGQQLGAMQAPNTPEETPPAIAVDPATAQPAEIVNELRNIFANKEEPATLARVQPYLDRIDVLLRASDQAWAPATIQLHSLKVEVYQALALHDQAIDVLENLLAGAPDDDPSLKIFLQSKRINALRRDEWMDDAIVAASHLWHQLRAAQHPNAASAGLILARMLADEDRIDELKDVHKQAETLPDADGELADAFDKIFRRVALRPGTTFPDFAVTGMDGKPLRLSDYRGTVVLIDFWATWCAPCIADLPYIGQAHRDYQAAGFDIIGINLDADRTRLDAFLAENPMPWRQYFDGQAWDNELANRYGVSSIPATYLVDEKGIIIGRNLNGPALIEAIEAAVGQADTSP